MKELLYYDTFYMCAIGQQQYLNSSLWKKYLNTRLIGLKMQTILPPNPPPLVDPDSAGGLPFWGGLEVI